VLIFYTREKPTVLNQGPIGFDTSSMTVRSGPRRRSYLVNDLRNQ